MVPHPCTTTSFFLTLCMALMVRGQDIGPSQLAKLARSPAGLGAYMPSAWAIPKSTVANQGQLSLNLRATAAGPFIQGAYLAELPVWIYFPFDFTVTGFLVYGNMTRSTSPPGRITHFKAGYSVTKSYLTSGSTIYILDGSGSERIYTVTYAGPSEPSMVLLNVSIVTQLALFEVVACQTACVLQLDLIGYPSPTACPAIATAEYTWSIAKSAQETVVILNFTRIYYLTSFVLRGLAADTSFWVSYQSVLGEPAQNLTHAWNSSLYVFPVSYTDERFIVPFILTPLQLRIHLSPTSAVTSVESLTGCAIETCPPGWMRGLTGFCWHREEATVSWSDADQYCANGLTWGGRRGKLLLAKTVVERNVYANPADESVFGVYHIGLRRNSSTGAWLWSDGTQPEAGAFYMTRPPPECAALDSNDAFIVSVPCDSQLQFICQVDMYLDHVTDTHKVMLVSRSHCGVAAEDDAMTVSGYGNLLRLQTLDSLVTDQIEVYNTYGAARSTLTSVGLCDSVDSIYGVYYMFPIDKGCALPLFSINDGQLGVRFEASSSNYRRNANYSIVGAASEYSDHLKCTVAGADYKYYDYGVTMTGSGRACRARTGTYSAYNRSCITVTAAVTTNCQAQGSATTENCHPNFDQLLCVPNFKPPTDLYSTREFSITSQKVFYYNDVRISSPTFSLDKVTLNTGAISTATPSQYWRLVVDLKSNHHVLSGEIVLTTGSKLNNFSVRVNSDWNISSGELAFEAWPVCYTYNLPEVASSPLRFWCEQTLAGRYVAFLQGVQIGRLSITSLQLHAEEEKFEETGTFPSLIRRVPAKVMSSDSVKLNNSLTMSARLRNSGLKLWLTNQYEHADILNAPRWEISISGNGSAAFVSEAVVRTGDATSPNTLSAMMQSSPSGPVAVITDDYQIVQLVWTQSGINVSIAGSRLASLTVTNPIYTLDLRTIGYTTLGDDSEDTRAHVMFDFPNDRQLGIWSPMGVLDFPSVCASYMQYIQAKFTKSVTVFVLAIQGGTDRSLGYLQYPKYLSVSYSTDGESFTPFVLKFLGARKPTYTSFHGFYPEIFGRAFRMYANTFHYRWESRWMLYGCLSNRTAYRPPPVLMSQYLALVSSDPNNAKYLTDGKRGPLTLSWSANSAQPWIAVDFVSRRYIEFALIFGYSLYQHNLAANERNVYSAIFATNQSTYSEATSVLVSRNFFTALKQPWRANVGLVARMLGLAKTNVSLCAPNCRLQLIEIEVYGNPLNVTGSSTPRAYDVAIGLGSRFPATGVQHGDVGSLCDFCADMYSLPLNFPGDESFHHTFINPDSSQFMLFLPHTYALTGLLIRGGFKRLESGSLHGMVTSFRLSYSATGGSDRLMPFNDLQDGSIVTLPGPDNYVETSRVNFQRSILAKLVKLELPSFCNRRQLKMDLIGYPNDLSAAIINDLTVSQTDATTLLVKFGSFYHINSIVVNRTAGSYLSFYIIFTEVDGEANFTLQLQGDVWMFETRDSQATFEFPILLAPLSLQIKTVNGSLTPQEVSFLGKQSEPCPPGFVPMGDSCIHLGPVTALRESARRVCRSFVWAGGRGDLLMLKDASVMSYLAASVDYLLHVGIVRNGTDWFWLDGSPVPSSHWRLGQPGDVYGLWSTSQAALVAAASGEQRMFACQLPQASQGIITRTLQVGHVTFSDQRSSIGGNFGLACVAQSSPGTSRSQQLLYNRVHLLDETLSRFSISHVQSSSTAIFSCSVTSDLLSGAADASIRTISTVPVDKGCFQPLLGQSSAAQVTGFPFSASFFDASNAHLGSEMRLRHNCLIVQGDRENYVYPVNVTAYGRVCISTDSAGSKRDYKNYCISTTPTEAPFCNVDALNTRQSCILHNCLHNYNPWNTTRLSHNIAFFKSIYYNGQRLQNLSRTSLGFLQVLTGSLSAAAGSRFHSLVVDFKSVHLINGVDMIAAGSQPGLRILVGQTWQQSMADFAFNGWRQCGAVEVPQLSTDYSIGCSTDGLPYRFLAVIRLRELGSLNITAIIVYGKEYFKLDERVQLRPEWLPEVISSPSTMFGQVSLQARLQQQTLKLWLTDQTTPDAAMLNKRYIVHVSSNGSATRLSNCTVEHKDYGQADFILASLPINTTASSASIMFDTDNFANLTIAWQSDDSVGATKIEVYLERQLLGGCWDSIYRIGVSRVGYSGLLIPPDPYGSAVASPQIWLNQTDTSTMGAFSPNLLSYLSDGSSSTDAVFIQAILQQRTRLFSVAVGGGADVTQVVNASSSVTEFAVALSETGSYWEMYRRNQSGVFTAHHVTKHRLLPAPTVRGVRLYPLRWQRSLELRWQLYGCPDDSSFLPSPILLSRHRPTGSNNGTSASTNLAVDGNLVNHVLSGLCYQAVPTAGLPHVYWYVSLGDLQLIAYIFIVDMVQGMATVQQAFEDMQSVSVFIGNSTDTSLATIVDTWTGGFMKSHLWTVKVNQIASVAGLLKASALGNFSFCEFEVYGYPNVAAYYYINWPIGLEDGRVQANQLGVGWAVPASPFDGFSHPTPYMAALNRQQTSGLSPAAFFATIGSDIYLEIQLDVSHTICGLVWQGSGVFSDLRFNNTSSYNAFVTTVEILYGNSTKTLQYYSMYGTSGLSSTISTGLIDSVTPLRMSVSSPFKAKIVRILPKGATNLRLLRMEILGYPEDCDWLDSSVATVSAVSPSVVQVSLSAAHILTGWKLSASVWNATFSLSFVSLRNGSVQNVSLGGTARLFNCSLGNEQYLPMAIYTTKLFINFSDPSHLSTGISLRGCRMLDCPANSFRHGRLCYWVPFSDVNRPHTVANRRVANDICQSLSWLGEGRLARMTTEAELQIMSFIFRQLRNSSTPVYKFVHIDGQRSNITREFNTYNGQLAAAHLNNWQTTNESGDCLVAEIGERMQWRTVACDSETAVHPFICEIPAARNFQCDSKLFLPALSPTSLWTIDQYQATEATSKALVECQLNATRNCSAVRLADPVATCSVSSVNALLGQPFAVLNSSVQWSCYDASCDSPLVSTNTMTHATNTTVKVAGITAKSSLPGFSPERIAFNFLANDSNVGTFGFYRAATTSLNEWFQVEFVQQVTVKSVAMSGIYCLPGLAREAVTSYIILYSRSGIYWGLAPGIMRGPVGYPDSCISTVEQLSSPVVGRTFRIYPLQLIGRLAGKLELFGCSAATSVEAPAVPVWPHQLTVTQRSSAGAFTSWPDGPQSLLLPLTVINSDSIGKSYELPVNASVRVTFPVPHRVYSLITAGYNGSYISTYDIVFGSTDESKPARVPRASLPDRTLLGGVISELKFVEDLPSPVIAKYLVLTPKQYYGDAKLQIGILAFPVECPAIANTSLSTAVSSLPGQIQISFMLDRLHYLTNLTVVVRLAPYTTDTNILLRVNGSQESLLIPVINGTNFVWLNRTFATKAGILVANLTTVASLTLADAFGCSTGQCPVNYYLFEGVCRHHHVDGMGGVSRSVAESYCQNANWDKPGTLFLPASYYDYAAMRLAYVDWSLNFNQSQQPLRRDARFHIGVSQRSSDGQWVSASNSSLTWRHWAPGQPAGATAACAASSLTGEAWTAVDCGLNRGHIICQVESEVKHDLGCTRPYYNVFYNYTVKADSNLVIYAASVQSALLKCQAEACKSLLATVGQSEFYGTMMDTVSVGFQPTWQQYNFYIEQVCRKECWYSLTSLTSNVTTTIFVNGTKGNSSDSLLSRTTLSSSDGVFNAYYLTVTLSLQVRVSGFGFTGAGNNLWSSEPAAYDSVNLLYFDPEAAIWTPATFVLTQNKSFGLSVEREDMLNQVLIFQAKFAIVTVQLRLMPLQYIDSAAFKFDIFGCALQIPTCVGKNRFEFGGKAVACQNDWAIFYRNLNTSSAMNFSIVNYQDGFEFDNLTWLGLRTLSDLTTVAAFSLRIDAWISDGGFRYVECRQIKVSPAYLRFSFNIESCNSDFGDQFLFESLNKSTFSTFDFGADTNCALVGGSGWWYIPGCNSMKLTGVAGGTGNDAVRWSSGTTRGAQIVMRIISRNYFHPPKSIGELCYADASCAITENTVCLSAGILLDTRCACRKGFVQRGLECKALIDSSVQSLFLLTSAPIMRDVTANVTVIVHARLVNGTVNLTEAAAPRTNFIFAAQLRGGGINATISNTQLISGDPAAARYIGEDFNFSLTLSVRLPAGSDCLKIIDICIVAQPGDSARFFDYQLINNEACIGFSKVCQPALDVEASLRLVSSTIVTRSLPAILTLETLLMLSPTSSVHVAAVPMFDENFAMASLLLCAANCTGSSNSCLQSVCAPTLLEWSAISSREAIAAGSSGRIQANASTTLNLSTCESYSFICTQISTGANSSLTFSNASVRVACVPLIRNCTPFADVEVSQLTFVVNNETWIRRYPASLTVSSTLRIRSGLPIEAVPSPRINFQPIAYLASTDMAVTESSSSRFCDQVSLQQSLINGSSIGINCIYVFNVSANSCSNLRQLCVLYNTSFGPSYTESDFSNNLACVALLGNLSCSELSVVNASCQTSGSLLAPNDTLTIQAAWQRGSAVRVTLAFSNHRILTWDWLSASHVNSFYAQSVQLSLIFREDVGLFNFTCRIGNEAGDWQKVGDIVVAPQLKDFLRLSMAYVPQPVPLNATVNLEMIQGSPVSNLPVSCYAQLQPGFYRNFSQTILPMKSHNEVITFTDDAPYALANITCWNQVSTVTATYYVILQENITQLWFNSSQLLVPTNHTFQLLLSVSTGSHVTYQIDFGNGTSSIVTDAQLLAWRAPDIVNVSYNNPGRYLINIVASNYHSRSETRSLNVLVQNPVRQLMLQTPRFVELSALNASILFTHPDPQPTNASCRVAFGNMSAIVNLSASSIQLPLRCYRALLFEPEFVKLTCWNLVSEIDVSNTSVSCQEAVNGLNWTGPTALRRAETSYYSLTVTYGSALRAGMNCGDGRVISLTGVPGNTSVQYASIGNFTAVISVWNDVSNQSTTFGPVVVQEIIRGLVLEYNASVLYTPAEVHFRLTSPIVSLTNVHCLFSWAEFGSRYLYLDSIGTVGEASHVQAFPRAALGLRNFSLNCSNLVSFQTVPITVDIILDAVIIGSFRTNGSALLSNATYFFLNITRFGTNGCFVVKFGDSTAGVSFGVPDLCQAYSESRGINFTAISYGNLSISFSHIYSRLGSFSATIFAFNHVSNDTAETLALIMDWMCDVPKLNFSHSGVQIAQFDPGMPLNQMRSTELIVEGLAELNCSKTSSTIKRWRVETTSGVALNLSFSDSFTFRLPARTLWYGLYKVVLNLSMADVSPPVSKEFAFYINITKTPLSANFSSLSPISAAYNQTVRLELLPRDWDVESGNLTAMSFQWICMQQSELTSNPNTSRVSPPSSQGFIDFRGCFGSGVGVVFEGSDNAGSSLLLNTYHMLPNVSYALRVTVFKDSRTVSSDWQIFVHPQDAAVITIVCEDNCAAKVTPRSSLTYKASCEANCATKFSNLNFNWAMRQAQASGFDDLAAVTESGFHGPVLIRRANTLVPGVAYIVQVSALSFAQYNSATVSKNFIVNKPASGGNCTIQPREGIAMETKFRISCWGWVEFNVTSTRLTYEYRIRPKGSVRTILLFYGPTAVSPEVVLPVGSSIHGYKSDAYINVVDSVGDKVAFIFDVKVNAPPIPASELLSGITAIMDGSSNELSQHLKSGNQQGAATTLMCLTSVMNAKNEDAEGVNATSEKTTEFNKKMTELRTKLIAVVANFSIDTPEDLEQTNDVLRSAIPADRTSQVTIESQELGASKLQEITSSFGKFKDRLPADIQPLMGSDIVFTGSNIWSASDSTAKLANNETAGCSQNSSQSSCAATTPAPAAQAVNTKVRGVIESVLTTVESVSEILLNSSGSYSISDAALSVQGLRLNGSSGNVSFQSAHGEATLPPALLSGCDSVKAIFSGRSPYVWQPTTSVASSVLMIEKRGCRSRRAVAPSISESFIFSLPATGVASKAVINATPTDRWLSFYHSVNVTSGVLQVTVQPLNASQELQIFVQLDRVPTPIDYFLNASKGSFYLPAVSNGTYMIGIKRAGCYRETSGALSSTCSDPSLSYEFGLALYDCLVWDASLESWRAPAAGGASCTVEASEVPNRPRFVSNLFGSLGAGMNVLPNLIDFGTLFQNWQGKLADSAAVVGTVVALWIIFIPIAVFLRRVDNKDNLKFQYLPLVDDHNNKFVYKIDVFTASERRMGGTNGCPLLSVGGELHRVPIRILSDGVRKNFQTGDINHFTMTSAKHLGDILEIGIALEGQRPITPWKLRRIVITDLLYNVSYIFPTSETISPYQPPLSIQLANKEQLAFQQHFVRTSLSRKFLDDHLWMSVVKRKTDTNFTRLQRFGVCFCLLFMTMISNAMFYGVGEGGQSASDYLIIGPIKLSINTLVTSILGAVVVVPVSAAVTIFFLKSKRRSPNDIAPEPSAAELEKKMKNEERRERYDYELQVQQDSFESGIIWRCQKSLGTEALTEDNAVINPASTPLTLQAVDKPSRGFQLPHWCQYVGWALVLGSMLAAGLFLVFYAMQWGKEKSQQWLLSFVLSFVQTALLVQPLKVALIGCILVVLFRKDYDVESLSLIRVRYFNEDCQKEGVAFLHELEARAKLNPVRRAAINATLKLIITVTLLLLQYCICYGNIDPGTFQLHKSVKFHLKYNNLSSATRTASQLYKVINVSILPAVFPKTSSFLISDGCGYRLSRLSLRQLRRRRNETRRWASDDETGCFLPGWIAPTQCNLSASLLEQAFMNRPEGATYAGLLADYRGGGFTALLPDGLKASRAFLADLQHFGWLDSSTSLLVIELDLFYSDVNMFTSVAMATELQPFGGAQASSRLLSTHLYRYVGAIGVFALVSEILAGLLTLVRLVFLLVQLRNWRQFFANFENWLDAGVVVAMLVAGVFYGLRTAGTGPALEAAINGGRPQLRQLLLVNEFFFYSLGVATFLQQLSLLGLIRFSRNLGHLLGTLRGVLSKLSSFAVFFCVIFFAFCCLMNLLLGPLQLQFNSPAGTMSTMFSAMLGKFDMATVSGHGLLPKLAFSFYVSFLMFIVMNLFVVILNDSYECYRESGQSDAGLANDFQIVQFVMQRLRDTFTSDGAPKKYKEAEDLETRLKRLSTKFDIVDSLVGEMSRGALKWDSQLCLSLVMLEDSCSCSSTGGGRGGTSSSNGNNIVSSCRRHDRRLNSDACYLEIDMPASRRNTM